MPQASRKLLLREWYVISTRPLGQHAGVRRSAAALGARVFSLSTLRLQAVNAAAALPRVLRCPRILVTSPAAARFAHAQCPLSQRPGQRWLAIGAGTAAALHRCGIADVLLADSGADSESLLEHPQLRDVAGEPVGLISAPGGRGLLARELQARGARLEIAEVYRRQALVVSAARLRQLDALPATTALLFTSDEAFSLLWQVLDQAARGRFQHRPCIVASPRLAARAQAMGFRIVVRAVNARPPSLLAALREHVGVAGFR